MNKELYTFVQQCAEAIGNSLDVEVTIIDSNYIRIAGTGKYKKEIGKKIPEYFVSASVIKTGNSYMIDSERDNEVCKRCREYQDCDEKGHINIPITDGKDIYGAISILCLNEKQFDILLKKQNSLQKFLKNIGDLLISKFKETEYVKQLELNNSQFNVIFSSMSDGVLMTDEEGFVINCSDAINKLLRISKGKLLGKNVLDFFTNIDMEQIKNNEDHSQFIEITFKNRKKKFLSLVSTIIIDNSFKGIILALMEDTKLNTLIYSKMNTHQIFTFDDMIGESQEFTDIIEMSKKAANFTSNVLILGESGTGKELFARSIHNYNKPISTPFIAINCAAIPESLLESELFGYEEGAFTGAKQTGKPGKFELANGGTIFLDEIGDMPLHLQAKILRVLQDRTIERIGGINPIPINVRLIAATNKDLASEVRKGNFRADLYYRLNVLPVRMLSLRERKQDILVLANLFLQRYSSGKISNIEHALETDAINLLYEYDWPGNIRQLENAMEYIANVWRKDKKLSIRELPEYITHSSDKLEGSILIDILGNNTIWILRKIMNFNGLGRRYLAELAKEEDIDLTEGKIRSLLNSAEVLGLVETNTGRKGTVLTEKGYKLMSSINNIK
ncbi:sigma 54-interacting transcriptional regulator [Tissierella carlieri]|uniref:sigma-54 interaction domain-containing protein n=1 Tax=Tissierella carlieri TaxID=689904 RepID=UPI001C0F5FA8|nr:sigma 54-interacting transcriptional regulator [Tissierella carlieri]MBU5310426.1 sigma 54-interacting transcriptional regulator [Tissierella carlieri]